MFYCSSLFKAIRIYPKDCEATYRVRVTIIIIESRALSTIFMRATRLKVSEETRVSRKYHLRLMGIVQKERVLFVYGIPYKSLIIMDDVIIMQIERFQQ